MSRTKLWNNTKKLPDKSFIVDNVALGDTINILGQHLGDLGNTIKHFGDICGIVVKNCFCNLWNYFFSHFCVGFFLAWFWRRETGWSSKFIAISHQQSSKAEVYALLYITVCQDYLDSFFFTMLYNEGHPLFPLQEKWIPWAVWKSIGKPPSEALAICRRPPLNSIALGKSRYSSLQANFVLCYIEFCLWSFAFVILKLLKKGHP